MASEPNMISFASRTAMAGRLADVIEAQLARSLAEHGTASLAASGGSTPTDLYRELSTRSLDWSNVRVVPVDERWVPPGTVGSNETLVRSTPDSKPCCGCRVYWSVDRRRITGRRA